MSHQLTSVLPTTAVAGRAENKSNGAALPPPPAILSADKVEDLNMALIQHMLTVLEDGRQQANSLYNRLRWTYWLIIVLATLMFLVGLTLISSPLWGPFTASYGATTEGTSSTVIPTSDSALATTNNSATDAANDNASTVANDTLATADTVKNLWPTLIPAGAGALTFIGLFLFNPIARVQKLMGDMSQLIMMLNSFHIRVALRLVEIDSEDRQTIGAASEHVAKVAKSTLDLVETLFEQWLSSDLTRTAPQSGSSSGESSAKTQGA